MTSAYRPLHGGGVAHALASTLLYLDLDRQGFAYPLLPVRQPSLRFIPGEAQGDISGCDFTRSKFPGQ